MNPKRQKMSFCVLLTAAALIRVLFAVETPAWWAPDEYAHYWVAEEISRTGTLPQSSSTFPVYEAYQSPLYYVAAALVIRAAPGMAAYSEEPSQPPSTLILLRLFSALLGLATIWAAYRIFDNISSLSAEHKILGVAFMAFLPTYVGSTASVSNDAMVVLLAAVSLYYSMQKNWSDRTALASGIWAGAALLTKMNALVLLPFIFFLAWRSADGRMTVTLRWISLALVGWSLGAALLVGRNLLQYQEILALNPGVDKQFGLSVHNIFRAIRNLNWSFWLAFGRSYRVTPAPVVYVVTALPLMLSAIAGWVRIYRGQGTLLMTIMPGILLAVLASLGYTFLYPPGAMTSWGKNAYVVLPLIAIFMAIGWSSVSSRCRWLVPGIGISLMLAGSLWGLVHLSSL